MRMGLPNAWGRTSLSMSKERKYVALINLSLSAT